jgi:hypothetical protein
MVLLCIGSGAWRRVGFHRPPLLVNPVIHVRALINGGPGELHLGTLKITNAT